MSDARANLDRKFDRLDRKMDRLVRSTFRLEASATRLRDEMRRGCERAWIAVLAVPVIVIAGLAIAVWTVSP